MFDYSIKISLWVLSSTFNFLHTYFFPLLVRRSFTFGIPGKWGQDPKVDARVQTPCVRPIWWDPKVGPLGDTVK